MCWRRGYLRLRHKRFMEAMGLGNALLSENMLHSYQTFCVGFIEEHPFCGIFLDMGLGKTSIALTAISHLLWDSYEVSRVLIIAPLRVARDTWLIELAKWEHLKTLRLERVLGTPKERIGALSRKAELYIINRENVEWLVKHFAGRRLPFDMLVIDELSSFKNSRAKRFLALKKVIGQFFPRGGPDGHPRPQRHGGPLAPSLPAGPWEALGPDDAHVPRPVLRDPQQLAALQARAKARRGGGHLPAFIGPLRIHASGGPPEHARPGG